MLLPLPPKRLKQDHCSNKNLEENHLPIVLSHTHRDHIAGITSYSSENTTVLTGTEGRTALERQFGKTLTSPIVEVSQHQIIDLGNRRIQIFAMPSDHALKC